MIKQKSITILLIALTLLIVSCESKKHPEVPVHFERYDQAVFTQNVKELTANYPQFTPLYFQKIIQIGTPEDSLTATYLQKFTETYRNNAYDSVQLAFPNMKQTEKALAKALGNYSAHFPNDSLPKFYTHFSGFNDALVTSENIVSVSLENYLGASPFYDELGVYQYLQRGMYPDKIPSDIIKILLLRKAATEHATDNLLAAMIYQGKIYYALHKIFPKKSFAFFLNYTKEQEEWCEANEPIMWSYLIENKQLFSSDYRSIRSYIDPAPFTKGFPNESPGQTGIWIGYQIVAKYMGNNETSLAALFKETNYKKILHEAAYNPE